MIRVQIRTNQLTTGPPRIFDLNSQLFRNFIIVRISSVLNICLGDDFDGRRRRQEIGKLLCWKWNYGNCQSQGSPNHSHSLGRFEVRNLNLLESHFGDESLWDGPWSPNESSKEIYRSRRNRNFCLIYQRKISMRTTLGGKCLRQIHRWVSFTIIISTIICTIICTIISFESIASCTIIFFKS